MSAQRYLAAAQNVAQTIPGLLVEQGLEACIDRFYLTETEQGDAWLFVVLEDRASDFRDAYATSEVLSRLSAALHGHRVMFSQAQGLRYAVLLGGGMTGSRSA